MISLHRMLTLYDKNVREYDIKEGDIKGCNRAAHENSGLAEYPTRQMRNLTGK